MRRSSGRAASITLAALLAMLLGLAWRQHAELEQAARPLARQGLQWFRASAAAALLQQLRAARLEPAAAPLPEAQAQQQLQGLLHSLPWPVWQPATPVTPRAVHGRTWYVSPRGSDSNDGLSPRHAFATPQAAADVARAGDTVLIAAGLYRGTLIPQASGRPGSPIVFGSDGSGPVILDGSPAITGWRRIAAGVWSAPVQAPPIAVVVDGQALRPSPRGVAGVTSGSGLWAVARGELVVDFGDSEAGHAPDPDRIVAPSADGDQKLVYFYDRHDLVFQGLTVRGSGASGIWGYGSDITVRRCNLEFNGKAGINFMPMQGNANSGNQAIENRVSMNVLLNWPRGNNGFAASGGGWSGGLVFAASQGGVARGNLVYDNGGEGMISFGSGGGRSTGGTLFEHNVVFDNWSVNLYFDNQPADVARANIVFDHPPDTRQWLKPPSAGYPWNELYKFHVCLMLADEAGSSDGPANLAQPVVIDNLIAGCRIGIRDYAEGALSTPHGLKQALIANNTLVLPRDPGVFGGAGGTAGIELLAGSAADTDSLIANNALVGGAGDPPLLWLLHAPRADAIRLEHNVYAHAEGSRPLWLGSPLPRRLGLRQWQDTLHNDRGSLSSDAQPLQGDIAGALARGGFFTLQDARPRAGSMLRGNAADLSKHFDTALDGTPWKGSWTVGALP